MLKKRIFKIYSQSSNTIKSNNLSYCLDFKRSKLTLADIMILQTPTKIYAYQHSLYLWTHRLLDLMIPAMVVLQLELMNAQELHDRHMTVGLLAGLTITFIAQMNGTYSEWRGRSLFTSLRKVVSSWILSWLLVFSLAVILAISETFSREIWLLWFSITPILLVIYRILIRTILSFLSKKGIAQRNILIIGAGDLGQRLASNFDRHVWMGYNVIGYLDDDVKKKGKILCK